MFRSLLLLAAVFTCFCSYANADTSYANSKILEANGLTLSWNYTTTEIVGELRATRSNWLIFGVQSAEASWSGTTDWIVAWLDKTSGIGHFSDRYSLNSSTNIIQKDEKRDWTPLDVAFEGLDLVVKFSRPIIRCDSTGQDVDLSLGTMNTRFAYGEDKSALSNSADINLLQKFNVITTSIQFFQSTDATMINMSCPAPRQVPEFTSQPSQSYANYVELAPSLFRFYWDFTQTSITGEIHVKTTGWVGFGLSPDGGMYNSDVFVGWITNTGRVNFTDRHVDGEGAVLIDAHQDWQLLSSSEKNGYTVFKFTRLIKTCDSEDRDIETGSPHVIFAWGDADPAEGSDITYHGFANRGAAGVLLISSPPNEENELPKNMQKLQFTFDSVVLPRVDTYYYNEVYKLPNIPSKMHILKYDMEFPEMNYGNMHHFNIFQCVSYNGAPALPPGDSTTDTIYDEICQSPMGGWAVGGSTSETYPKNTGVSIGGGDSDYSYLRMEIHYNNPNMDFAFIDKFTLTLYMTSELRQYDVGTLMLGTGVDPVAITLPPNEQAFNLTTYCFNSCIRSKLGRQNINIIRAYPHTHLTGVKVSTRLVRNGVDMGIVYENPYYDFNFQQTYTLYPPVVVTPEDDLITRCVYSTTGRKNYTYGGFGTKNEMCLQYLTYYPRVPNFAACLTIPDIGELYELLDSLKKTGDISLPELTDEKRVYEFINAGLRSMNERASSPSLKAALLRFNELHNSNALCAGEYDEVKRPPVVIKSSSVVPDDTCSPKPTILARIVEFVKKTINSIRDFFKRIFSW